MERRWPQALIMISGAILLALGVVAIGVQLFSEIATHPNTVSQAIKVAPGSLEASTRFVGLELVLVGALLEIVGYLATTPWKVPPQSN